ncbi:hypothetical protein AKJ56_01370 [candidate division MSBL1 archaeon SCGC-AAA382N08]|uniref:Uncharacterized protein n=1 Tax=candidate division MSBL1 archaeon SCGC-AAA382N08 TaxID=1698285 RepID=A0A133VPR4_9EURY|nr:hypothetical protein AKJ56_01370 [candidate division MSBL1 archaeon SCGC-AAA382N08]
MKSSELKKKIKRFKTKLNETEKKFREIREEIGKIPLHKLLLRKIGLSDYRVRTYEIMDEFEKNWGDESVGTMKYHPRHIYRVLKELNERYLIERKKYNLKGPGRPVYTYDLTEQGGRAAAYFWKDLEYDEGIMELREK